MKSLKLIYLVIWIVVIAYFAWILTPLKFIGAMICIGVLAFWSFVVATGRLYSQVNDIKKVAGEMVDQSRKEVANLKQEIANLS